MNFPKWLIAAVFASATASIYSLYQRYQVESLNKAVTLVAEMSAIDALAAGQGLTRADALARLSGRGLGGVVLSERTVAELEDDGALRLENGRIVALDPGVRADVERGLSIRFPGGTEGVAGGLLRTVATGLSPDEAEAARSANLRIVARASNPAGAPATAVTETMAWLRERGADVFLPQGDQVLGRREAMAQLYEALESQDMLYASPEFGRIAGDTAVLQRMPERVVRLHSAQAAELDRHGLGAAVERYVKAGRERNMRILLLRPISNATAAPVDSFGGFVQAVAQGLAKEGGAVGTSKPFLDPHVPVPVFVAISLGTVAAGLFLASAFGLSTRTRAVVSAALLGMMALAITPAGREYAALAAAILYPTAGLAILHFWRLRSPLAAFLVAAGFAFLGGLATAGLLTGLPYMIRAETFSGVKVAAFLPILLVGMFYFGQLGDWRRTMRDPITYGAAALGLAMLAAVGFMLIRTGNDAPAAVSEGELQFRGLLEQALYVRPRTKEFLIGHPLLFVGAGLLAMVHAGRQRLGVWAALALGLSAIGTTSIVNTFCHLHTPITISLARVGIGAALGSIIGLGAWAIVRRFVPKEG